MGSSHKFALNNSARKENIKNPYQNDDAHVFLLKIGLLRMHKISKTLMSCGTL